MCKYRKKLQVSDDAGQFASISRDWPIAIDTHEKVAPLGQMKRQRYARPVAELGLLFPHVAQSLAHIGVLIPNNRHALALAMLHDRIASPVGSICEGVFPGLGRVVNGDELSLAEHVVDHHGRRHRLEAKLARERNNFLTKGVEILTLQH